MRRNRQGAALRKYSFLILAALSVMAGCGQPSTAPESRGESPDAAAAAEDAVNLDLWLERLEVGSRELYSARNAVVDAVGLEPGDAIADIGAGTGLYTLLFAEAVGSDGAVFAVDIEPLFLELINRRAADAGYDNVTAVLSRDNSVTLPKNSVDVVFIADTYHYFEDRKAIMATIQHALKPGGRLVIVDYDVASGAALPDDKSHVRFGKSGVISEIEFIGFERSAEKTVDGLSENYFIEFVNPPS